MKDNQTPDEPTPQTLVRMGRNARRIIRRAVARLVA